MSETFTINSGKTYAITDIKLGPPREDSFVSTANGEFESVVRFQMQFEVREIAFRSTNTGIKAEMVGAITFEGKSFRIRVKEVVEAPDGIAAMGVALTRQELRVIEVSSASDGSPMESPPESWRQFGHL